MNEYQKKISNTILNAPIEEHKKWKKVASEIIGNIISIGFSKNEKYLLVLSWSGRGVFECSSGEKIARDHSEPYTYEDGKEDDWNDDLSMTVKGIGPIDNEDIHIVGMIGGGLHAQTEDGWHIKLETINWPDKEVILSGTGDPRYLENSNFTRLETIEMEPRAIGFSPSGDYLLIATPGYFDLRKLTEHINYDSEDCGNLNSISSYYENV